MQKIFIIHGWTYTLDRWQLLKSELEQRGYEPVFLQVPGLTSPSEAVWDMAGYVEWLCEQITNETDPIIIAHSNGGRIAMAYDAKYPKHISRAFLISTAGVHHPLPKASLKRKLASLAKPFVRGRVRRLVYRLMGASDYGNAPPNMRKTMANMLSFTENFDLTQVSFPVVLIWGKDDHDTPVGDVAVLESKLQNVTKTVVFDGVDHRSHAAKPKEVATIVAEVLED